LLRERNAIDAKIAAIVHMPMTSGNLGEWIAHLFDIELEPAATAKAITITPGQADMLSLFRS
jgi:hypothetical protein